MIPHYDTMRLEKSMIAKSFNRGSMYISERILFSGVS